MDAPSYADATRTAILIYSDAAIGLPSAPWRPYDREASRAAYLRRVERKVRQHYPNVTIVAVYVNDVQRLAVVMDDDPTPPGVYRMSDGIRSMAWDIGQYGFDGWAVPVPVKTVATPRKCTRRVVLWHAEEHGASTEWQVLEEEYFRDADDITT